MDVENMDKIDAEDIIQAKVNRPFVIALDSLATAGYVWTIKYDSHYLKLNDEKYLTNSQEVIGSGGRQIFSFTPLKSGEVDAEAIFKRPGEDKVLEEKRFRIRIIDSIS
jgi:predicted secreted protein